MVLSRLWDIGTPKKILNLDSKKYNKNIKRYYT